MTRSTFLTISLALFCAVNFVECQSAIADQLDLSNIGVGISASSSAANKAPSDTSKANLTKTVDETKDLSKLVEGVQDLKAEYSPRFILQPRIDATSVTRTTITYKLGKRVTGDRVVATNSQNQQWSVAQNVTQHITYPRSGVGLVITYVEIIVDQSSNLGRGYVTSGGIGQRQIAITVEAQKTLHFRQTTTIYGY